LQFVSTENFHNILLMEKNELQEILKTLEQKFQNLKSKLNLEEKNSKLENLKSQTENPNFWNEPEKAQKISQEISALEKFIKNWQNISQNITDFSEILEISNTEEEIKDISEEISILEQNFYSSETELILSGEYDTHNVLLSLKVGNGGQDAEDFTQILLRMYLRFCERKKFKTSILEESTTDDGLRSATIEIKGHLAYGYLKSEHGVHRLIRLSPFNAKNLRQTSFARIEVLPEIEDNETFLLEEKDLKIDVFRSSGAGGQSVNTTDSAVRITYLPLNLVVTCQNQKSQHQNKDAALKVLRSRLAQLKLEQKTKEIKELRGDLIENSFGSQIRTYTLQPYKLVKDHRTNYEENNPDKVFDGEIDGFIQNFLQKNL